MSAPLAPGAVTTAPTLRRRRGAPIVAAAALIALLAACSGSAGAPLQAVGNAVNDQGSGSAAPAQPAPAASSGSADERGPVSAGQSGSSSEGTINGPAAGQSNGADTAYIIKNGSLTIEVKDIADSLDRAQTAIMALGGYVSASQRSNNGDETRASVTYRIPADRWDDALAALHKLATKIVVEQTGAVEVTGQVLDLGARIDNLQATERALQGIMTKAVKIPDVLEVEQQLSTVQGQIEELSTEKKHLEDQAALGTLNVDFTVHTVAVAVVTHDWSPSTEIDRAVASLVGIGQTLVVAGVWFFIVWLPVLLGLGILLLIAWVVARRIGLLRRPQSGPSMPLPAGPEA